MENADIQFSIITAVYNREDCIANCIRSVVSQDCSAAFEHIIVDDGSTDRTFEIVQDLAHDHNSVVALQLSKNMGPNAARNAAIKTAKGKYIIILDSDDTMIPGALETITDAIKAYPESKHLVFTVSDRKDEFTVKGDTSVFSYRDFLEQRVGGDFTHVILRSTMLAYPFDEEIRVHEGVFFLSFYKEAENIRFINSVLVDRDRGRDDRVTYSLMPDNKDTLQRNIRAINILAERFTDDYKASDSGRRVLAGQLLKMHRFATLLGRNAEAADAEKRLKDIGFKVPFVWNTLNRTYLGVPFFGVAKFYIKLKFALGHRPK